MRTCMATNCRLHIIEPISFQLNDKNLKRAGMDYVKELDYTIYPNYDDFLQKNKGKFVFITRYGKKAPNNYNFKDIEEDIYLVFGKESTGIPYDILHEHLDDCVRLPMVENARSLNLSNTVAIMAYHVLEKFDYLQLCKHETIKGEDFIFNEKRK
ncbi:MAG: TrmH family RNA methyltransferase [Erysipelotrichaceae bacterium]